MLAEPRESEPTFVLLGDEHEKSVQQAKAQ